MRRFSRRSVLKAGAAAVAARALSARALSARAADSSDPADVLILGAGMSGLHAARLLEQAGVSVMVLEGSGRIGGRCWTAHNVRGAPELGAQQIGAEYGRVRGNAAELGVELVGPPQGAIAETHLPPLAFSVGQAPATIDWAASPMNHLVGDEKAIPPTALLPHYLFMNNPLVNLDDWQKPENAHIDQLSLRQFVAGKGASPEAQRLLDVSVAAHDLDDVNALDILRKNYYYSWEAKHGPYSIVREGTSALTDAMAASLKRGVALNQTVTRITAGEHSVAVRCRDGTTHRARRCIATIPLSVMRNVAIDGPVPPEQLTAWRTQRYSASALIFLRFRKPYWEQDGLPAGMWTDSAVQFVAHLPSRIDPRGVLVAFCHGRALETLSRLSPAAFRRAVVQEIERVRPAAVGQIEVEYVHNWGTYPFSLGHIAYFAPGDIGRYARIAAQPVGALHFAGEHNCRIHAGIEGACEAAENASIEVLTALGAA